MSAYLADWSALATSLTESGRYGLFVAKDKGCLPPVTVEVRHREDVVQWRLGGSASRAAAAGLHYVFEAEAYAQALRAGIAQAKYACRRRPHLTIAPAGYAKMDILFLSEPGLKIISGGQTGVDRAALEVARELGLPHGGWCPAGRRAEDDGVPLTYPLEETAGAGYLERTRRNIHHADATLVLNAGKLTRGTLATVRYAAGCRRPYCIAQLDRPGAVETVRRWLEGEGLCHGVLNVAGPRESKRPGIGAHACVVLREVLSLFSPER